MDKVDLNVPVMLISTKTDGPGKTEKRYLTPFGALDIKMIRIEPDRLEDGTVSVVISGAVEEWLMYDLAITEFRKTLLDFVYGIIRRELNRQESVDKAHMVVDLKKTRINLTLKPPEGCGSAHIHPSGNAGNV